ncbi:Uncharacterised protein [Mycobacteroides abscessus subsp. abscessus]|nr:Uncharacterised protein [Mycobacteroides abscessus subsp. abscessus]
MISVANVVLPKPIGPTIISDSPRAHGTSVPSPQIAGTSAGVSSTNEAPSTKVQSPSAAIGSRIVSDGGPSIVCAAAIGCP